MMRTNQVHPGLLKAFVLYGLCLILPSTWADVKLPAVIGNHMVLQREKPVPIWGRAEAGEKVTVTFDGQTKTTTANSDGEWKILLDPLVAIPDQKPQNLVVSGNNTLTLENILIGEVWLCSGQSNMEQGMGIVDQSKEEIAAADHPNIRLMLVPKRPSGTPQPDVDAMWVPCNPMTISQGGWGGFSGVGFFFGRKLHEELKIPIGLIGSSWGGTRIEPWTPPIGFAEVPALAELSKTVEIAAPGSLKSQGQPTGLYNGMIHPLVPFAIRGAIWYQGEANMGEGMLYHEKMKALIAGWRSVWGYGEAMPFYFVQLAPFQGYGEGALPLLWEAQTATLNVPNTGMSVTTDITSNMADIHPRNKQDVGKRLALWALAKTYKMRALVYSGPLYRSMKIEGSSIRISFAHTGSGLKSRDDQPLTDFTIAGADGISVPATATIEGDTVLVHADRVSSPTQVTFGWHKLANPNLCNAEGLPASPFRTENWKGSTGLPPPPAIVYAGKAFEVKDMVFKPRDPAATWSAHLFYRPTGGEVFTSLPVPSSKDHSISVVIPGTATKTPLDYYLQFKEDGQLDRTIPLDGADEPLTVLPDVDAPSAITDLRSGDIKSYLATISWDAATDDREIARYEVFRGDTDGFATTPDNRIGQVASPSVTFSDPMPPAGKTSWYAVQAIDAVERSGPVTYQQVTVPANQAPQNELTLTALAASNKAFLKWSGDPEPDVVAIDLLRGEGKTGELKLHHTLDDATTRSYTDADLAKDTVYRYAIRLRDRGDLNSAVGEPQIVQTSLFIRRINCAGETFAGEDGIPWEADRDVIRGTGRFNAKGEVSSAGDLNPVYTTERWSNTQLKYTLDAEPGRYEVILHFAETNPSFAVVGKRTFDVYLNGQKKHENVDVFKAGGARTVWTLATPVELDLLDNSIVVELKKTATSKVGPALKGLELREMPD
ncbi:MAG: sialate O-acetylesterase [Kiritimatiellia bacterium]|jgi:sialate O-acetylesterase